MIIKKGYTVASIIVLLIMIFAQSTEAKVFKVDRVDGSGYFIVVEAIEEGDADTLTELTKGADWSKHVLLNSAGGLVYEAFDMANIIRKNNAITYIGDGNTCASACAFVYVAGVNRAMHENARFGIHAVSVSAVNPSETLHQFSYMNQRVILDVMRVVMYYVPESYEYSAFQLFYTGIREATHKGMYWASIEQLVDAGIVLEVIRVEPVPTK